MNDVAGAQNEILLAQGELADALVELTVRTEQLELAQTDVEALAQLIESHCSQWKGDQELAAWVDGWLIPTFALGKLLRQWEEQPALVSELQAMKLGYSAMVETQATPGFDAISWHDALARFIDRVPAHRRRLTAEEHAEEEGIADLNDTSIRTSLGLP